jgi:triosephosphate isomerase (TIM)
MVKLVVANWKMNKTAGEAVSFIGDFKNLVEKSKNEIVICAPFTSLSGLKKNIKKTGIKLGAQNMHYEEQGAFTGEISPLMLKEFCDYVILGHSERRQFFKETDGIINKKIKAALKNDLKVILCVGETLEQRKSNKTEATIRSQLNESLKDVEELKNIVVAYEPIWAIGTGKNASPHQAQEVHSFIRELLNKNHKNSNMRIIYGGSVNENNAKDLLKMQNIDGALVGGASLDPKSFANVCNS